MLAVEFSAGAIVDLAKLRTFDGRRILDAIERQLTHERLVETRNRKILSGFTPPFDAVPPIWELRVGDFRVFYDVSEDGAKVFVRAVRRKPPHRTPGEIT